MKNFMTFVFCISIFSFCLAQTSVSGKVTGETTKEVLIGANISFKKGGDFITGCATDFDGNYKINIDAGIYDVIISYIGLMDKEINGIIVKEGQNTILNISLIFDDNPMEYFGCGGIIDYKIPLIDKDNTTSGRRITSQTIQRAPVRNINNLVIGMGGVSSL